MNTATALPFRHNFMRAWLVETLIDQMGEKPFTVVFVKANGETRTLRGYVAAETEHPKGPRRRVHDIDVHDFRTIPCDRVLSFTEGV